MKMRDVHVGGSCRASHESPEVRSIPDASLSAIAEIRHWET